MPKGKILHDTLEKLAELGVSSAKKTVKSVKQTVGPSNLYSEIVGVPTAEETAQTKRELEDKKGTYTPLKMEELLKKHDEKDAKQDKVKQEQLRARLFQLVKEGEKKAIGERKHEQEERVQTMVQKEEEKKRKEEEKRKFEEHTEIPRGKIRRSIFSPKKVAQRQHVETRASSGKQ